MQITDDLIKDKAVVGSIGGFPVVMVETYGGLYAAFCKSGDSSIKALAAAPHKGILRWMCEKKEPKIQWKDGAFHKSEDRAHFDQLRAFILGPSRMSKSEPSGYFLTYDSLNTHAIALMDKDSLVKSMRSGEVTPLHIIRSAEASEPQCFAVTHPLWKEAWHG